MKDYLLKFRSQAFEGAMSLFKRTLIPNFVLNIVMSIISLAILIPIILKAFGWGLTDFMNFGEKMQEMSQTMRTGSDSSEVFKNMFSSLNFIYLFLAILLGMLIYCWMFYTFLKLNDNEVRTKNNGFVSALAGSFSGRIFTILGFSIVYALLYTTIGVIFIFLMVMLIAVTKPIGILLAFFGFFVIVIFMLRFSLGLPAIVHGNMSISEAMSFSYRSLTWKRAGMIFLVGLILMIVLIILSLIITGITFSIIDKNSDSITSLVVQQIFSSITSAIIGAFIYASLTALYFRYSNDNVEETDYNDHLVEG